MSVLTKIVDCKIIDKRSMVLAWAPDQYISGGMMTEVIHATVTGKDVAVARDIHEAVLVINAALERMVR